MWRRKEIAGQLLGKERIIYFRVFAINYKQDFFIVSTKCVILLLSKKQR